MKLIGGGMIGDSNSIGTRLNGLIQELKPEGKRPFQFLQIFYINKGDRTSHWFGHSKLKELYTNDLLKKNI